MEGVVMNVLAASEAAHGVSADEQAVTAVSTNLLRNRRIREELDATSEAVLVADEARVQEAMRSVHWERRGPLQRLTRASRRGGRP
jgi:hypothetical protein